MRGLIATPLAQGASFVALYVASTAVTMRVNEALFPSLEWPWTWYWLFEASLFAPAVLSTLLAAAFTAPDSRRLRPLYAASLLGILVALETCFVLNVPLMTTGIVVGALCLVVVAAFMVTNPS